MAAKKSDSAAVGVKGTKRATKPAPRRRRV